MRTNCIARDEDLSNARCILLTEQTSIASHDQMLKVKGVLSKVQKYIIYERIFRLKNFLFFPFRFILILNCLKRNTKLVLADQSFEGIEIERERERGTKFC